MDVMYLTLEQSIRGAMVFLNTFGLVLEEQKNIDHYSNLNILDDKNRKVGKLYFDNGKVIISANSNFGVLNANYDIPRVNGFIDYEYNNALFAEWNNNIDYTIEKNEKIKISGNFLIDCFMDSVFGVNCTCHSLIDCEMNGENVMTLTMLRDGRTFGLEIVNGDIHENIDVMPFDDLNGFIIHCITQGKWDSAKFGYPCRKYAGVHQNDSQEENMLKTITFVEEYDDCLSYNQNFHYKVGDENSSELLIQKGLLMQQIDPDMFETIKKLKGLFLINGVSLLDNLISVCLTSYSDDEIKALLGIDIIRIQYQNNTDNLINAYYGTGEDNKFLSSKAQKKLLRK